jgi:hypothetical protein
MITDDPIVPKGSADYIFPHVCLPQGRTLMSLDLDCLIDVLIRFLMYSCFCYAVVAFPLNYEAFEINLEHLNFAISYEGPNGVDPFDHLRACHNLLGYSWRQRSVNCRKNYGTWVGDRPNLVDILVPFAMHEIASPQVQEFKKEARRRSL